MAKESGIRLIANNKKAYHDYFIEDTYEAGIELCAPLRWTVLPPLPGSDHNV